MHAENEVHRIDEWETSWVVRWSVALRAYPDDAVNEAEDSPGEGESMRKVPVTTIIGYW